MHLSCLSVHLIAWIMSIMYTIQFPLMSIMYTTRYASGNCQFTKCFLSKNTFRCANFIFKREQAFTFVLPKFQCQIVKSILIDRDRTINLSRSSLSCESVSSEAGSSLGDGKRCQCQMFSEALSCALTACMKYEVFTSLQVLHFSFLMIYARPIIHSEGEAVKVEFLQPEAISICFLKPVT